MKQSCDVIKDLLILYEDDACSEDSRALVEEHLKSCEECRKYSRKLMSTDEVIADEMKEEFVSDTKVMKQSFKKIRRRWILSLIAVFMLIPAMGIGILGYHEKHNEGIAFSNVDDVYRCIKYLRYIENKKFEKAAEMVNFSQNQYTLVESVADMTLEEYQEYMKGRFIEKLQEYDTLGIYIDNISFDSAYRANGDRWTICVSYDENYPDGSEQKIVAHLNSETMYAGAWAYPYKGKTQMDDYIDEILCLYSEDDPLEYQDFEAAFELKEGEKAVIRQKKDSDIEVDGVFNITYGTGTSIIEAPFFQDSFVTSVPGKYAITGYTKEGEMVFMTMEDVEIEIVNYK